MAFVTDLRNSGTSLTQRATDAVTSFKAAQVKRRLYNVTLTELSQLTNRELTDLGIARGAIRSIAYEAAYGK